MAFNFAYLSKIGQSQQIDPTYNAATGDVQGALPTWWNYNASSTGSNESAATVEASGYFNGAKGYMKQGDVIYVYTNDPGYHFLNVASNNGTTVTTAVIV